MKNYTVTAKRLGSSNSAARDFRGRAIIEAVEARRLMSTAVASWSANSISDISGTYFGGVVFGDNGNVNGYPTSSAGAGGEATVWACNTWDSNLDDGLDSNLVSFQMGVNAAGSGTATFTVGDSDDMSFATGTSVAIHQVTIQAAVCGDSMKMEWDYVTVSFYRGGELVESVKVAGPVADTIGNPTGGPAESVVTVFASASNYDGVYVTGTVRLVTAEGTYPNPSDIFGQVAIS